MVRGKGRHLLHLVTESQVFLEINIIPQTSRTAAGRIHPFFVEVAGVGRLLL